MVDSELDPETIVCAAIGYQTWRTEAVKEAWSTVSQSEVSKGTSVVDQQVQSGTGFQEVVAEAVDGLQAGQVQLQVQYLAISCYLLGMQVVLNQRLQRPLLALLYLLDVRDGGLGPGPVSAGQDHSGAPLGQMKCGGFTDARVPA